MNRRPSGSMTLTEAVFGFVNYKYAKGLTERSVNSYERLLNKWIEYEGDNDLPPIFGSPALYVKKGEICFA